MDQEFKNLTLRDIRLHRDKIQKFLDETYREAECAVENLFRNQGDPDFLKNLDEMNSVLKVCRERLVKVVNLIPESKLHTLEPDTKKKTEGKTKLELIIPKVNVVFNNEYRVTLLSPSGSPSRFWLSFDSASIDNLEKELQMFYKNSAPLKTIPCPGTFVICSHSGKYCRGKVWSILEFSTSPSQLDVIVILVDYGEEVTTSIDKLFPIQEKFCSEPAHGLLCSMKDLKPPSDIWEMDAIVFFISQCEDIVAIFHPPVDEQVQTDTFSNFTPDYYVSLYSRNSKKDVGLAMAERGLAFPMFVPHCPPPKLTKSEQQMPKKCIQPKDCRHDNAALENPKSSNVKSQDSQTVLKNLNASNNNNPVCLSVPEVVSKGTVSMPVVDCTPPPGFPPKIRTPVLISPIDSVKDILNSTVPETISSSDEPTRGTNRSKEKVFAIPFLSFANNHSSAAVNVADDVDELLRFPAINAVPQRSNDLDEIDHEEAFFSASDPLLMEQFLDSLGHTMTIPSSSNNSDGDSFFTPASQSNISDQQMSIFEMSQSAVQPKKNHIRLDYQYGAVLKPRLLPPITRGAIIHFCLSHVLSPTQFYVHLADEIPSLIKPLTERLNTMYQDSKEVPVTQPEIGSFWVVQESQTKCWSRAVIVDVESDDTDNSAVDKKDPGKMKIKYCSVFLVDWGNADRVKLSQLRPLIKEILHIPCLALPCRLDGVHPLGATDSDDWKPEATDKFIELAGTEKELSAVVSNLNLDEDGALPLVMLKDGNEEKYSVNELLVFYGYASSEVFKAKYSSESWDTEEGEWDPMAEDFYSWKNTVALDTENYDSVTAGYIPQDEKRICRFFRANGFCRRGIKCGYLHIQNERNVFTEDKIEVFIDVPALPSLVPGNLILIEVSYVVNSYRFYCILAHDTNNLQFCRPNGVDDDGETLESLQESLQQEYDANYYQHRMAIAPSSGDIVIARSPDDNKWYRARVMTEEEGDYYGIYFVDYGNNQLVHLRDLCKPMPRFIHLPAQAVEMFLNGVDTSEKGDTQKARDLLTKLVSNRKLVARVISVLPFMCVDLHDMTGTVEIDIVAEMVRRKVIAPVKKAEVSGKGGDKIVPG